MKPQWFSLSNTIRSPDDYWTCASGLWLHRATPGPPPGSPEQRISKRPGQTLAPGQPSSRDTFLLTADAPQAQNSETQFSKAEEQFYCWVTSSHWLTGLHFQAGDVRMVVGCHSSSKAQQSTDRNGKEKPTPKTTRSQELRYLLRQDLRQGAMLISPAK